MHIIREFLLFTLLISCVACNSSSSSSGKTGVEFGLSGVTQNYDPSDQKWRELLDGATEAGVETLHLQTPPWFEGEVAKGVYDFTAFDGFFRQNAEYGLKYTIDIATPLGLGKIDLPAYLGSRSLDDAELVERYTAYVDAVLDHFSDAAYVILHTETAGSFYNNDVGSNEFKIFSELISNTAQHIRNTNPGTSVGVYGTKNESAEVLRELNRSTDFFGLGYIADRGDDDHQGIINRLVGLAGNQQIGMYEMGVPTSPRIGGSEARQVEFVTFLGELAKQHADRLLFISYYQHADEDRAISEQYVPVLFAGFNREQQLDAVAFFSSLGLKNVDLTEKAAWSVFKGLVSKLDDHVS